MLFFGGLGSMFRRMARRERKLGSISLNQMNIIKNMKEDKFKSLFNKEKTNLYHFLQKHPLKFKKLNKRRLNVTAQNYFASVYKKKSTSLRDKIDHAVNFVYAHKRLVDNFVSEFKARTA